AAPVGGLGADPGLSRGHAAVGAVDRGGAAGVAALGLGRVPARRVLARETRDATRGPGCAAGGGAGQPCTSAARRRDLIRSASAEPTGCVYRARTRDRAPTVPRSPPRPPPGSSPERARRRSFSARGWPAG